MSKGLIYIAIGIGSSVGAYLPVLLFHANVFSVWSILGSVVGSFAGIAAAWHWFS